MILKQALKKIAHILGLQKVFGDIYFYHQFIKNQHKNRLFLKNNPSISIPPNREIFETFQLDYAKFFTDGLIAAKELIEVYTLQTKKENPHILDWGCGMGRITQFIPSILPNSVCYGADIHPDRIRWNRTYLQNIYFDIIEDKQLPYPSTLFDFVIGISVFTHIPGEEQAIWLKELHRITKPNAIIICSTHGSTFEDALSKNELNTLRSLGYYTNSFKESGHRMMSTYNVASQFQEKIETYFTLLSYYNGKSHPSKLGGQDLWIMKKNE